MPKIDTREKLLQTAIELIWQSHYAAIGVNEICEKAGITKGAFYHHFDSKASLFYDASHYYWEQMKAEVDAIFSPEHSAREQLEQLLDFILAKQKRIASDIPLPHSNPVSGCPFFTAGAQSGAEEEKIVLAAREMSEKAVRYNTALIRNLQAEGAVDATESPQLLAEMMYQYIQGLLLYGRVFNDLQIIERHLREGVSRLLGIKKP